MTFQIASEGTFVWAGGPEAGRRLSDFYVSWPAGEPNDSGGREDCVEFFPGGEWNDLSCGDARLSVIEYSCPPGQEFGSSSCQGKMRQSVGCSYMCNRFQRVLDSAVPC
jgi:hypothetical protein